VLNYLTSALKHRQASEIFELCNPKCACASYTRAYGLMALAAEMYPDPHFHDWLLSGIDASQHPRLIKRLRRTVGVRTPIAVKREPPPICTSPSLGR